MSCTIACLDMAGTTVADDGVVMDAFETAISNRGLSADGYEQAMKDVRATMGQSKIEVFRRILGDEDAAIDANEAFENHYQQLPPPKPHSSHPHRTFEDPLPVAVAALFTANATE
jgi:hypothetical protein